MRKSNYLEFDVVIAGAGPGGCSCAIQLEGSGLSVAVIEKSTFPRDKICGDALSPDVLNQLEKLGLKHDFMGYHGNKKVNIHGVKVYGTKGNWANIKTLSREVHLGWVVKREDFDLFMFRKIQSLPYINMFENCTIIDVKPSVDFIEIISSSQVFRTRMLVGADGANSVVARKLARQKIKRQHHSAAVRAYFSNVTGTRNSESIELHFFRKVLPGYFWIFPLPNNQANVGLGMLSARVSRKKVNLKKLFYELIEEEPELVHRFANARMLGKLHGFGLPLGSIKRRISGERFLLVGDAAALIDPLTGEGVGNAIRSGRFAADQITSCFKKGDFSSGFMKAYDRYLFSKVWNEMRVSRFFAGTLSYPVMLNFLIDKASKKPRVRLFLGHLLSDPGFWANGFKVARYIKSWNKSAQTVVRKSD